jgi:tRNA wybutosine-synthesizing protein 1
MKMMKTLRGIEGALPERLKESQTIRHCALSLVGEPIMYPRINEVLQGLHDRRISSFLVTNAQFPQAILDLNPVTQLYVSVDASTKDALKEIDRPLFTDFWERFNDSLDALGTVNGRTVFRLTLVKDRNIGTQEALDGYARLIARSKPDLVEIKGVTFCGKSNASDITMKDVPWHHEVRLFSEQLCERIQHFTPADAEVNNAYGVACEHAHSVCVLLARKDKFYVENDGWYTWIDFDRFLELAEEWRTTGKRFNGMDFRAKTPEWAVYGSKEEGFDPSDTRFRKVRRHKSIADTASVVDEEE